MSPEPQERRPPPRGASRRCCTAARPGQEGATPHPDPHCVSSRPLIPTSKTRRDIRKMLLPVCPSQSSSGAHRAAPGDEGSLPVCTIMSPHLPAAPLWAVAPTPARGLEVPTPAQGLEAPTPAWGSSVGRGPHTCLGPRGPPHLLGAPPWAAVPLPAWGLEAPPPARASLAPAPRSTPHVPALSHTLPAATHLSSSRTLERGAYVTFFHVFTPRALCVAGLPSVPATSGPKIAPSHP